MREIRIEMWDLDVDYELAPLKMPIKTPREPISIIYWLSSKKIEELGVEEFKQVAREQFEKMLERWEQENEHDRLG